MNNNDIIEQLKYNVRNFLSRIKEKLLEFYKNKLIPFNKKILPIILGIFLYIYLFFFGVTFIQEISYVFSKRDKYKKIENFNIDEKTN